MRNPLPCEKFAKSPLSRVSYGHLLPLPPSLFRVFSPVPRSRGPTANSSFYSYYRCFVTRPCERAVTKLAQCRSQVKPREDGARTLFFSFTRVRSQPMASDLSCVTLLPRPDRTGKLIAKVKRNKGATPSESLGRLREGGREKEREADRRACRDREKGRKKQAGRERYKMLSIGTSRPGNRFPRSIPRSSREAQADTLDSNFLSKDVP